MSMCSSVPSRARVCGWAGAARRSWLNLVPVPDTPPHGHLLIYMCSPTHCPPLVLSLCLFYAQLAQQDMGNNCSVYSVLFFKSKILALSHFNGKRKLNWLSIIHPSTCSNVTWVQSLRIWLNFSLSWLFVGRFVTWQASLEPPVDVSV